MKVTIKDTKEVYVFSRIPFYALVILLLVLLCLTLVAVYEATRVPVHQPNIKYSPYQGCIVDPYNDLAYCNPIHNPDGSWVDVRTNPKEKYLK